MVLITIEQDAINDNVALRIGLKHTLLSKDQTNHRNFNDMQKPISDVHVYVPNNNHFDDNLVLCDSCLSINKNPLADVRTPTKNDGTCTIVTT